MDTYLTDELQARRDAFVKNAKPEWIDLVHASTEALRESGIAERAPQVGERAPSFTLSNVEGEQVALDEVLAGGPAVLSFYRGRW